MIRFSKSIFQIVLIVWGAFLTTLALALLVTGKSFNSTSIGAFGCTCLLLTLFPSNLIYTRMGIKLSKGTFEFPIKTRKIAFIFSLMYSSIWILLVIIGNYLYASNIGFDQFTDDLKGEYSYFLIMGTALFIGIWNLLETVHTQSLVSNLSIINTTNKQVQDIDHFGENLTDSNFEQPPNP